MTKEKILNKWLKDFCTINSIGNKYRIAIKEDTILIINNADNVIIGGVFTPTKGEENLLGKDIVLEMSKVILQYHYGAKAVAFANGLILTDSWRFSIDRITTITVPFFRDSYDWDNAKKNNLIIYSSEAITVILYL